MRQIQSNFRIFSCLCWCGTWKCKRWNIAMETSFRRPTLEYLSWTWFLFFFFSFFVFVMVVVVVVWSAILSVRQSVHRSVAFTTLLRTIIRFQYLFFVFRSREERKKYIYFLAVLPVGYRCRWFGNIFLLIFHSHFIVTSSPHRKCNTRIRFRMFAIPNEIPYSQLEQVPHIEAHLYRWLSVCRLVDGIFGMLL